MKQNRVKFFGHWEFVTCMKEKFPLNSLDNRKIVKESFYSNFENVEIIQIIL